MKLPIVSSLEVIKILYKLGFSQLGQEGSHVILLKEVEGRRLKPVIPVRKELAIGTLLSILKQAELTRDDFISLYYGKEKRPK
ncbi:MAG: type II toxin-antitoxin system HicA family toxin [Candidatus Micrarchaeota archaeon]|nr:type II toxin-antitoxin system HicA family toxin [Candidatus Micrarchaeota archaeon]